MLSLQTPTTRKALQWTTMALGGLSLALVTYAFTGYEPTSIEGRLLPDYMEGRSPWVSVPENRIMSGTTLPPDTNVLIHIPEQIDRITRRVLFGRGGETIRYWGYCLPSDYERAAALTRRGFPGELFLSEAEREARRATLVRQRRHKFSIFKNLTNRDLNETQPREKSMIRHQKEIFTGGENCYFMSEKSIFIGSDQDGDGLNAALERGHGSDPKNPDTDGDGIVDGLEVFRLHISPIIRDSDGDGLIDGIEDANHNGRYDVGETMANKWDTDGDSLCDGVCKVNKGSRISGEDRNLNGIVDANEYDPRKKDTDGDGISDDFEVELCILGGGSNC